MTVRTIEPVQLGHQVNVTVMPQFLFHSPVILHLIYRICIPMMLELILLRFYLRVRNRYTNIL